MASLFEVFIAIWELLQPRPRSCGGLCMVSVWLRALLLAKPFGGDGFKGCSDYGRGAQNLLLSAEAALR